MGIARPYAGGIREQRAEGRHFRTAEVDDAEEAQHAFIEDDAGDYEHGRSYDCAERIGEYMLPDYAPVACAEGARSEDVFGIFEAVELRSGARGRGYPARHDECEQQARYGPQLRRQMDLEERCADSIDGFSLTESVGSGTAQDGSAYAYVSATGLNADALENEDLTLLAGRTLTDRDQEESRKVVLVSDLLVENLLGTSNIEAVGQTVNVLFEERYYAYTIVGVYEYEESSLGFSSSSSEDTETTMYMPLQTARDQNHNTSGYSQFTVLTADGVSASELGTSIEEYLNSRYYSNNESYEISTMTMESVVESMTEMLSTISLAIAAIAGISLLVGGIGVMNIMLVSITERTREIGTRKALGATNGSIRLQFITEAIVLCLVGGAIGIVLGITIAAAGTNMLGYAVSPSVAGIVLSVSFSVFIGVFFGYYPANKAAKLNPIEALRYE